MTFVLDDYKMPRAVKLAYRRLEAENQRLAAEVEWCRAQLGLQEEDIASLKRAVTTAHDLVPSAYREALERAARIADPETAERIRAITCPYK